MSFGFFNGDDFHVLKQAIAYSPKQYILNPETWQKFSLNNYTPWVIFSYQIDWLVFGLDYKGFYLHQFISSIILIWLLFKVLQYYFSRNLAIVGTILFVLSPPFVETSKLLWTRHYLEGLIFSILAIRFFLLSVNQGKIKYAILASAFYFVACLAKEVYIPVFLIMLLLLDVSNIRKSIAYIIPSLFILLSYFLLRVYMLETNTIGGYHYNLNLDDTILFLPRIFSSMGGSLTPPPLWWQILIISSLLSSIFFLINKKQKIFWIKTLIFSLLLLIPIFPVSQMMSPRYVLVITLGFIIFHLIAWKQLNKNLMSSYVCWITPFWIGGLMGIFIYASIHLSWFNFETSKRAQQESQFIMWHSGNTDIIMTPLEKTTIDDWLWIKQKVSPNKGYPLIIHEPILFCMEKNNKKMSKFNNVWFFDPVTDILEYTNIVQWINSHCPDNDTVIKSKTSNEVISIFMKQQSGTLSWKLSPSQKGQYTFILRPKNIDIPVPDTGSYYLGNNYNKKNKIRFILKFVDTEGRYIYSPELSIDTDTRDSSLRWKSL